MPLARVPLTGSQDVAMANVSLQRTYTFDNSGSGVGTNFLIDELNVQGLPSLLFWVTLSASTPVPGVLWNPLFSVVNTTAGGVTVPDWQPFTNGFILVPANVTTFAIRAAVGLIGARISVPAGQIVSVGTVLTAGG